MSRYVSVTRKGDAYFMELHIGPDVRVFVDKILKTYGKFDMDDIETRLAKGCTYYVKQGQPATCFCRKCGKEYDTMDALALHMESRACGETDMTYMVIGDGSNGGDSK